MQHTGGAVHSLHLDKPGIRGLGVAESHGPDSVLSALAGVVMRNDGIVDGFALGTIRVSGDDVTQSVVQMAASLRRDDISYVLVWGTMMSRYNLVDVGEISSSLGVPVLGLSDRRRRSAEAAISAMFPERLEKYRALAPRRAIPLHTGSTVYARMSGCTERQAMSLLNTVTRQGRIPEPVRLARLLAGAARLSLGGRSAAVDV